MAMVRLDKIAKGAHLASIKYNSAIYNGTLWVLGGLASGEREVHDVAAATTANVNGFDPIVLHASVEYMWEANKPKLNQFQLEAGEVGRAYFLTVGDIFTITDDLFDSQGVPVVGDYVGPSLITAGEFQKLSANDPSGTVTDGTSTATPKLVMKVIESTTLGADGESAKVLLVVKNHI